MAGFSYITMSYVVIEGGKKLSGQLVNQSSKNAAVFLLAAAAMVRGKVHLSNVPRIEEVERITELMRSIGITVEANQGSLFIDASKDLDMAAIDQRACEITRASLLFLGALSARERKYRIYRSGGCKLGQRTVRPHLLALEKLGMKIATHPGFYDVVNPPRLQGAPIVMYESGDTATGNAIMAAVLAEGETVIKMASANYMVQDLCYFLVKAGAKIHGIGTTTLTIQGVKELKAVKEYPVMPDPIVAMTFLAAGIVTNSAVTVVDCPLDFLELELCKLEVMGQKFELQNERVSRNGKFKVVDIVVFPSKLTALPDKIECRPYPGLNIDNLPLFIPILAKAKGRTLVHDWVYEDRVIYSLDLKKLGAQVTLIDTHRVWVEGPTEFKAAEIIAPPALRPAVNVLICMLAAKGKSILRNTYVIDRGYENIYETLREAGAAITLVQE